MGTKKKGIAYAIIALAVAALAIFAWLTSSPQGRNAASAQPVAASPAITGSDATKGNWTDENEAGWKKAKDSGLIVRTKDDSHTVWVDEGKWAALGKDGKREFISLAALAFKRFDFTRQATIRRESDGFTVGEAFGTEIVVGDE